MLSSNPSPTVALLIVFGYSLLCVLVVWWTCRTGDRMLRQEEADRRHLTVEQMDEWAAIRWDWPPVEPERAV